MKKLFVCITIFAFLCAPTLELSAQGRGDRSGGGRSSGGGSSHSSGGSSFRSSGGGGSSRSSGGSSFRSSGGSSRSSGGSSFRSSGGSSRSSGGSSFRSSGGSSRTNSGIISRGSGGSSRSISPPSSGSSTPSIRRPSSSSFAPSVRQPSYSRSSGGSSINRSVTPTRPPSTSPSISGTTGQPSITRNTRPSSPGISSRSSWPTTGNRPSIDLGKRTIDINRNRSLSPGQGKSLGQGQRPTIEPGQHSSTLTGRIPGAGNRPGITAGDQPSITAGDRPRIKPGDLSGLSRSGKLPGSGTLSRTSPAARTANDQPFGRGDRPTALPGTNQQPRRDDLVRNIPTTRSGNDLRTRRGDPLATLPGLDRNRLSTTDRAIRSGRFGSGARRERPTQQVFRSRDDRLVSLKNRFSDRNHLSSDRDFRRDGWRDRWDGHRHDWDHHWHDRHWYHDHWHHGFWPVYYPNYWVGYWWNRYPILSVFGISNWSVYRCGWATGYYTYYNPYATPYVIDQCLTYYDYSQPIQVVESAAPVVADETLNAFDRAMQEFYQGQYQLALDSANEALKELPNDAAVHEFRALVLFALGRYEESAATLYAVLSVGPGWDWDTLNSLYPSVDIYTGQLRALETYRNKHPLETAPRFVLAYHYLTTGYPDAAAGQFKRIVSLNPKDELSRNLLLSIDPDADVPKPEIAAPPKPAVQIQKAQLVGQWTAQRGGDQFAMDLKENGDFTWTFTPSNGDKSTVSGVWAVDENSVIALDMGEDDVMLAQLNLTGGGLDFYMLGDTKGAEPLKFKK